MKRIIVNLLVVLLIISQSFISPVFADDTEEVNEDFPETEEVLEDDEDIEEEQEPIFEESSEPSEESSEIDEEPSNIDEGEVENEKELPDITLENGISNGIAVPADLTVSEDANGNIIISTNDSTYLETLVTENTASEIQNYTAYVHLIVPGSFSRLFCNNYYEQYDSHSTQLVKNGNTVTISNNRITSVGIGNGTVNVQIVVNGYEEYYGEIVLEHAASPAPSDITVKVDTSGNIKITTSNTDWITSFASYGFVSFANYYIYNSYPEHPLDISNNGKTVTIPADEIVRVGVPNGTYNLVLQTVGFTHLELSKPITITKGAKVIDPETVNVTFDETNDTFTISSSNTSFIKQIATYSSSYNYSSNPSKNKYVTGGYIRLQNFEKDSYPYFGNEKTYMDDKLIEQNEMIKIAKDSKSVTISKEAIMNNDPIVKGYDYTIDICAKGYQSVSKEVENIAIGASDDLPNDITATYVQDKGLKISSSDSNWINGILYNQSNAGHVDFYLASDNSWVNRISIYNIGDFSIVLDDGSVIVTDEGIHSCRISSGTYDIEIGSYGYLPYTIENVEITGLKEAQNTVSIRQGDGILIIDSEDKDFLQNLAGFGGGIEFTTGPQISADFRNNSGKTYIYYDSVSEYAYIDIDDVKTLIKNKLNNTKNITVYLYTQDYEYMSLDYAMKYIEAPASLVVKGAKQLAFDDLDESKVIWISSNESVATVDENGLLKAVAVGTTTITAKHSDGGIDTYDSVDVKVTSNSKVSLKLKTVDNNTIAYVGTPEDLLLTVSGYLFDENVDEVEYNFSPEGIVSIENNTLTFLKPGVVTITANAVGKKISLKLSVYNIDKAKKVSMVYEGPSYIQAGDEIDDSLRFLVAGEDVDPSVELSYSSSKDSIMSVDSETGKLYANGKGSVKITATVVGDPGKRKATVSLTVVDRIIEAFDENVLDVDTNDAVFENEVNAGIREVKANFAKLDKNNKIHIDITDAGLDENSDPYTPAKVTYKSSNTSIATVDTKGYVTFKKAGQVYITCTVASNPKGYAVVSKAISIEAINYTPVIETSKFELNKFGDYSAEYPTYEVIKLLGTSITDCKITDKKDVESEQFIIYHNSDAGNTDTFSVEFNGDPSVISAKTYSLVLQFQVDDVWYKYNVSVKVSSTLPSVTPKVVGQYNTFTKENTLELVSTVKNGLIRNIEFVNDWADYDYSTSDDIVPSTYDAKGKLVVSGKIRYYFEGYTDDGYVEKTIKLPTASTKPTIKLNSSTVTLCVIDPAETEKTFTLNLLDANKEIIKEGEVELGSGTYVDLNVSEFTNDGSIVITAPVEKGAVNILYRGNANWDGWITLPLTIKVDRTLPKAKLSATSVTLNYELHPEETVNITLPGSSEEISKVLFENTDGVSASYEDGVITVETFKVKGSSKIKCTPYIAGIEDDIELAPVYLTVSVNNTLPSMALKTTTIKFDQDYPDGLPITYTLSNNKYNTDVEYVELSNFISPTGMPLVSVTPTCTGYPYASASPYASGKPIVTGAPSEEYEPFIYPEVKDGKIYLFLTEEAHYLPAGKYKLAIVPKYAGRFASDVYDVNSYGGAIIVTVVLY